MEAKYGCTLNKAGEFHSGETPFILNNLSLDSDKFIPYNYRMKQGNRDKVPNKGILFFD